jgi:type 1 glutamine amidotransferase
MTLARTCGKDDAGTRATKGHSSTWDIVSYRPVGAHLRVLLIAAATFMPLAGTASSAREPLNQDADDVTVPVPVLDPAFKGTWHGPSRISLPGPGPSPGQSLANYFEALETGPRSPAPANVLVLGGSTGFHHDSISTAMASIHHWGQQTGAWHAELRTDFALVNAGGGGPMNAGFQPQGLGDFDAVIIVSAEGDWGLTTAQRASLLDFVSEAGKGLVVIHGGLAANRNWPEWIDMVGGEETGHPFNTLERPIMPFAVVNEDKDFPAVAALPSRFVLQDELYVVRNWSRDDVNVLLRLDESRLDFTGIEDQVPPDQDVPIAWSKTYGRGRVFASSIGHTR